MDSTGAIGHPGQQLPQLDKQPLALVSIGHKRSPAAAAVPTIVSQQHDSMCFSSIAVLQQPPAARGVLHVPTHPCVFQTWQATCPAMACSYQCRGDQLTDRTSGAAAIHDLDAFCRQGGQHWLWQRQAAAAAATQYGWINAVLAAAGQQSTLRQTQRLSVPDVSRGTTFTAVQHLVPQKQVCVSSTCASPDAFTVQRSLCSLPGVFTLDTADIYGPSEALIGQHLRLNTAAAHNTRVGLSAEQ